MLIPENIRKCVAFLALKKADGKYTFVGTGFFYGRAKPETDVAETAYLITAKHVVEGVRRTGAEEIFVRMNLKDGNALWISTLCNDWKSHPIDSSIDVSVLRFHILDACDHLIFSDALSLDIERIKEADIGLGDEVFIAGLFKHHHGDSKNIPIIRIGNLAAMGEEKVETTEYGKIDAFLIEARSIGGLSGSPVFVNLGIARAIKGKVKFAESGRPIFYFLGLIHGHYDVSYSDVDLDVEGQNQINTGIAIVVPFSKINNVIEEIEKIER